MLNTLEKIEQPILQNVPQGKSFDEVVFPIQKTTTDTFQNTKTELPRDLVTANKELEQQEKIVKQKAGILKMIAEVLNDPSNTGKVKEIEKLAKKMSAFELANLMQDAETIN